MPEQLGIDGALRDRTTVDRNERIVFPGAQTVDDLGEDFFAHPGFTGDQYREIRRGNPNGGIQGLLEKRRLGYDAKALFNRLNFCHFYCSTS